MKSVNGKESMMSNDACEFCSLKRKSLSLGLSSIAFAFGGPLLADLSFDASSDLHLLVACLGIAAAGMCIWMESAVAARMRGFTEDGCDND